MQLSLIQVAVLVFIQNCKEVFQRIVLLLQVSKNFLLYLCEHGYLCWITFFVDVNVGCFASKRLSEDFSIVEQLAHCKLFEKGLNLERVRGIGCQHFDADWESCTRQVATLIIEVVDDSIEVLLDLVFERGIVCSCFLTCRRSPLVECSTV